LPKMIRKVVIPAAGLGTRLLSATKEQPKEMMPIFAKDNSNTLCVKPLLQLLFEQLYGLGFRDFCFIVGRGKRAIEDHFTPDWDFVAKLNEKGKSNLASDLTRFNKIIEGSSIMWINQPEPKGFGDAVYMAKPFAKDESFIVHAGDTLILSKRMNHLQNLVRIHAKNSSEATLLVKVVEKPQLYGVVEGETGSEGTLKVKSVVEKPKAPPSNLAIVPIYAFNPIIFKALEKTRPDEAGEKQLTNAIQTLIDWGLNVYAIQLGEDEEYLDIGTPETYWHALKTSYNFPRTN
jgi:UTP--glucose-1-phosphate uridylyltransferase